MCLTTVTAASFDTDRARTLITIPEPATLALVVGGLLMLGVGVRVRGRGSVA